MKYLFGLDIGTTGCKAILFDENGKIHGDHYIEYALHVISDKEIEQSPKDWWNHSVSCMKECLKQAGIDPADVAGVSVSSQGISFVPMTEDGTELGDAISWLDSRAEAETEEIMALKGADWMYQRTGKRTGAQYMLPKLMWVKKNLPDVYAKTYKFLMAHDYIIYKLCGAFVTDRTMAGATMVYDLHTEEWSEEICDAFGIDCNKMPALAWAGELAGQLTEAAAAEIGLTTACKVAVGAQDQKASAVGARLEPGVATLSLGTAGAMELSCDHPVFDDARMRIPCFSYTAPGTYTLETVISTCGAAQKWFKNTVLPYMSYREMDEMIEKTPVGSSGVMFYPHLTGASTPIGRDEVRGAFSGLSLNAGVGDLARSVQEGLAFQLRHNVDVAEEMGTKVNEIHVFGGGSKSRIWCHIIAGCTGRKVVSYACPEIALVGAAMLAAKACGMDTTDFAMCEMMPVREFEATEEEKALYNDIYAKYRAFEDRL